MGYTPFHSSPLQYDHTVFDKRANERWQGGRGPAGSARRVKSAAAVGCHTFDDA